VKILYDISVLGSGYYSQSARTGVARVIENVANQLNMRADCELQLCAYSSLSSLIQTLKYIENNAELRKRELSYTSHSLLNMVLRLIEKLYPLPSNKILSQITRKAFSLLLMTGKPFYDSIERPKLGSSDIFHATYFPMPGFIRKYAKIKSFITIYDLIPILYPQFFVFKKDHLLSDVMKSITPNDYVIAISQSTKNDLCNYLKLDPNRVFVTYLAASDLFHPVSAFDSINRVKIKYGIPEGHYILSLSTLEPRKNIDHTIRCFARIVKEQSIHDLNLVLVGTKGWNFDRIFSEIMKHDILSSRIILTGYVADEDLAAIYSGAQMFVYPSLYEGFGLPPLEAMKCGVPVITSNTSSLPEVVGDAGIMVNPQDTDALCQAITDIYRKPALRSELAARSVERSKKFNWTSCAQQTVRAYETALGK
jgi:glycosyltransferase involved in cell wall biosynthesis